MSDPHNFLSRWSRRKLEPSKEKSEPVPPETKPSAEARHAAAEPQIPAAAAAPPEQAQEPPFDPASLPPIESITAGTDIRDFLKPGVPLSLSRAALRRAWSSDPAIRDFIGIAENQWDFTNDSIAGFGPLDPAEVPRLLARIISSGKEAAEASNVLTESQSDTPQSTAREKAIAKSERAVASDRENASTDPGNASTPPEGEQSASDDATTRDASHRNTENDAAQNKGGKENLSYVHIRHGHGGALPD